MRCEHCEASIPTAGRGRIPRFCSGRCRTAAHRARHQLPREMTSRDRWVRHDRKRPIQVDGRAASSTDPGTWGSYRDALRARGGDGLGYVVGDGIACIDVDDCLVDGAPDRRAQWILDQVPGAYVEVSPSGHGLHIWGTAPEVAGRRTRDYEAYSTGRFITVTRNVYRHGGLPDISDWF